MSVPLVPSLWRVPDETVFVSGRGVPYYIHDTPLSPKPSLSPRLCSSVPFPLWRWRWASSPHPAHQPSTGIRLAVLPIWIGSWLSGTHGALFPQLYLPKKQLSVPVTCPWAHRLGWLQVAVPGRPSHKLTWSFAVPVMTNRVYLLNLDPSIYIWPGHKGLG